MAACSGSPSRCRETAFVARGRLSGSPLGRGPFAAFEGRARSLPFRPSVPLREERWRASPFCKERLTAQGPARSSPPSTREASLTSGGQARPLPCVEVCLATEERSGRARRSSPCQQAAHFTEGRVGRAGWPPDGDAQAGRGLPSAQGRAGRTLWPGDGSPVPPGSVGGGGSARGRQAAEEPQLGAPSAAWGRRAGQEQRRQALSGAAAAAALQAPWLEPRP